MRTTDRTTTALRVGDALNFHRFRWHLDVQQIDVELALLAKMPVAIRADDLTHSGSADRDHDLSVEGQAFGHAQVNPIAGERLDALLTENEARPRRDRLRMTRIHDLLLREGF